MQGKAPILVVCGTRPEAIKLAPLVQALRLAGQHVLLLFTGQHRDLAPRVLAELGLEPDVRLAETERGVGPDQLLGGLITHIAPVLRACRPVAVLVQGDTVSALAGALAAAYAKVPVVHVEAGLRTNCLDEPHPEEMHRRLIASVASLHFAPTERAAAHLRSEGVAEESIHVTGNTGIDVLLDTTRQLDRDQLLNERLSRKFPFAATKDARFLLVTVHRRENIGPRLVAIAAALVRIARLSGIEILMPMHPNPAFRNPLRQRLLGRRGIRLLEPVDHAAMVWLMQRARLLLTDSGGLQEEAPALGLRTLVLRQRTERPEAIELGAAETVALDADSIVTSVQRLLLAPPLKPVFPFGDGHAAERIAELLVDWLGLRRLPYGALRALG